MSNREWIGVDLDGTLAKYEGWHGVAVIGEPILPMVNRIRDWLAEGKQVRIFTARVAGREDANNDAKDHIWEWLQRRCDLPMLPVTNVKDFDMVELWDDRAIQVIPNTGLRADGKE